MLFRSDRKSTRLNSSHLVISYAVFCLKKKNNKQVRHRRGALIRVPRGGVCEAAPLGAEFLYGLLLFYLLFFFNDTATTEIYTLSLHDALPIYSRRVSNLVRRPDQHQAVSVEEL